MLNNEVNDQLRNKREGEQRGYQKSNRVYILGYSPERLKANNKNKWDLAQTKHDKPAHLLLKKQALKQKKQQLESTQGQVNHRNNIDRLINLISRSRTFAKTNDSGCQKMVRALTKLLNKFYPENEDGDNFRVGFQGLKRYSMTCSSNNYELFIQSKHNYFKESMKLGNLFASKQHRLQKICQNIQQHPINSQSSQYNSPSTPCKILNQNQQGDIFTFKKIQTPKKQNIFASGQCITTQQDLSFRSNSPKQNIIYQVKQNDSIKIHLPKAISQINCQQQIIQGKYSFQEQRPSIKLFLSQVQVLLQGQNQQLQSPLDIVETLNLVPFKKVSDNKQATKNMKQKPISKCNSPIMSLMYAIPTSINQQSRQFPTQQILPQNSINCVISNKKSDNENNRLNKSKFLHKQDNKGQIVVSQSQYVERMLFGQNYNTQKDIVRQDVQTNVQRPLKNPVLLQRSRKRVSSLPKITFTYASRQKFFGQANFTQSKQSFRPIVNNNPNLPDLKKSLSKNGSKQELHSTFQSKKTVERSNHRFNIAAYQGNPFQSERIIRSPNANRQKIAITPVSPRDPRLQNHFHNQYGVSNTPQMVRTQYYGDNIALNNKGETFNTVIDRNRQRILTIQPNWNKQVQFISIQQQLPNCCWQKRQTRAQSLNQRILVGLNKSNKFHI